MEKLKPFYTHPIRPTLLAQDKLTKEWVHTFCY